MRFFITGHTGFKGSWLIALLSEMGHEVSGFSLPPVKNSLFERAGLEKSLVGNFYGDVRDLPALQQAVKASRPDITMHLAAQPLVIESYKDPLGTFTTNVDGTRNFLESVTHLESPPVNLVVTTDKVYKDQGRKAYNEKDQLGGHDPYATSKAMADLMAQSWGNAFSDSRVLVARAGNVIGAFDHNEDRLIPDIIRATISGGPLLVRNPGSVRPWQHVLDCVYGYFSFTRAFELGLINDKVLNFGPEATNVRTVQDVISVAVQTINPETLEIASQPGRYIETEALILDSSLAQEKLAWRSHLSFEDSIGWSLEELSGDSPARVVENQISRYLDFVSD